MASYKDAQWNFLVGGGGDITAHVVPDDNNNIIGCLLRINLIKADNGAKEDSGFGMMLVSPEARGQGLARKLLGSGMRDSSGRNILAICTPLGQAVYRKLDFEDVGRVVGLSAKLEDIMNSKLKGEEEKVAITTHSHPVDKEIQDLFIEMDKGATGYDRTDRLKYLMSGQAGSSLTIGVARAADDPNQILTVAAIRQDCPGGPVIVGPMIGSTVAAIPLVHALVKSHPSEGKDLNLSILLSDHSDLIDQFLSLEGCFSKGCDFPAMAQDDKPIYCRGENYLALIHPTLG